MNLKTGQWSSKLHLTWSFGHWKNWKQTWWKCGHILPNTFHSTLMLSNYGQSFSWHSHGSLMFHIAGLAVLVAPVSTVLPTAMEPWPVHRACYLSQTCCFQLSRDSRSGKDTLNDRLWKANWHLLLRCWPVAPSTSTVIIIWPCWSFMNIWTSWPYSVIISTRHSQKRTGHPS